MIGDGPDYYDGIDREGEKEQKLMDEIYDWWDGLIEKEQFNILLDWHPNEINKETDIDKFFGDLPNKRQLHVWEDSELK